MNEYINTREGLLEYLRRFQQITIRLQQLNEHGKELQATLNQQGSKPYKKTTLHSFFFYIPVFTFLPLSLVQIWIYHPISLSYYFLAAGILVYLLRVRKQADGANTRQNARQLALIVTLVLLPFGNISMDMYIKAYFPALLAGGAIGIWQYAFSPQTGRSGNNVSAALYCLSGIGTVFYIASLLVLILEPIGCRRAHRHPISGRH